MECSRDYHILRRDGADIDCIGESPLYDDLGGLILDRLEEDRIEVCLPLSAVPGQNPVLAWRDARD